MESNLCTKCGCSLKSWVSCLTKEMPNKNSWYLMAEGYFQIRIGCLEEGCVNTREYIRKHIGEKIFDSWLKDWKKEGMNDWNNEYMKRKGYWEYYLLEQEELLALFGKRLRYKNNHEYTLIRKRENTEYKMYHIFGYNGEQLYIKQTIGMKKNVVDVI